MTDAKSKLNARLAQADAAHRETMDHLQKALAVVRKDGVVLGELSEEDSLVHHVEELKKLHAV